VFLDYLSDAVEFTRGKTIASPQTEGSQPVFAYHPFSGNVDMGRFVPIEAVEEQPVGAFDILDGWHEGFSAQRCPYLHTRDAEDGGVEEDILAAGHFRIESRADLDQRRGISFRVVIKDDPSRDLLAFRASVVFCSSRNLYEFGASDALLRYIG
jgi:hypothetical protein